jgi:hypothetical protein
MSRLMTRRGRNKKTSTVIVYDGSKLESEGLCSISALSFLSFPQRYKLGVFIQSAVSVDGFVSYAAT